MSSYTPLTNLEKEAIKSNLYYKFEKELEKEFRRKYGRRKADEEYRKYLINNLKEFTQRQHIYMEKNLQKAKELYIKKRK